MCWLQLLALGGSIVTIICIVFLKKNLDEANKMNRIIYKRAVEVEGEIAILRAELKTFIEKKNE